MSLIKSVNINIFNGAFNQKITFTGGLNIISGVNGTGKTAVLTKLKSDIGNNQVVEIESEDGNQPQVLAFSPKRNTENRTLENALQVIRQNSRTKAQQFQEALGKAMVDKNFTAYESLGNIFIFDFEEKMRLGNVTPESVIKEVAKEYNEVIKRIFPGYELFYSWNPNAGASGSPEVQLKTHFGVPISLTDMSCGESEVLALIFNIYFNRSNTDIYLIDEPEIHLNWTLEKGLFEFFNKFAEEYNKQIIVTTHSRIIFNEIFRDKTQYFIVQNQQVVVDRSPSKDYLEEIAGETTALIETSAPNSKTFFVEDEFHKAIILGLSTLYKKEIEVIIVKDASGAIQNLYKILKSNNEFNNRWINAYLMIDGDGKVESYKNESRFIHLKRFTGESYFFELGLLSRSLRKRKKTICRDILGLIKDNSEYFEGHHQKFIEKILDKIRESDIGIDLMSSFDCSVLLTKLLSKNRIRKEEFIMSYLLIAKDENLLDSIFDKKLLDAIQF